MDPPEIVRKRPKRVISEFRSPQEYLYIVEPALRAACRRQRKVWHARVDLRVRVEGWGQVLWHMLLAWYCSPHPGLTRVALASKQAAHLNDNPRVVDFRQVGIEDKA